MKIITYQVIFFRSLVYLLLIALLISSCKKEDAGDEQTEQKAAEKIAFEYLEPEGDISNIYTIRIDGSALTKLTNTNENNEITHINGDPSWFPDGNKLAFKRTMPLLDDGNFYTMNADGSNVSKITNETGAREISHVIVSPDGKKFLYESWKNEGGDGYGDVYCMNCDGTNETLVANSTASIQYHSSNWFPDSKRVVYNSSYENPVGTYNQSLIISNLDGTNKSEIGKTSVTDWTYIYFISVSSDEKKIIFYKSNYSQISKICTVNVDGTNLFTVLDLEIRPNSRCQGLSWTPDGKIVFATETSIFIMNSDGTNKSTIVTMPEGGEIRGLSVY